MCGCTWINANDPNYSDKLYSFYHAEWILLVFYCKLVSSVSIIDYKIEKKKIEKKKSVSGESGKSCFDFVIGDLT